MCVMCKHIKIKRQCTHRACVQTVTPTSPARNTEPLCCRPRVAKNTVRELAGHPAAPVSTPAQKCTRHASLARASPCAPHRRAANQQSRVVYEP